MLMLLKPWQNIGVDLKMLNDDWTQSFDQFIDQLMSEQRHVKKKVFCLAFNISVLYTPPHSPRLTPHRLRAVQGQSWDSPSSPSKVQGV